MPIWYFHVCILYKNFLLCDSTSGKASIHLCICLTWVSSTYLVGYNTSGLYAIYAPQNFQLGVDKIEDQLSSCTKFGNSYTYNTIFCHYKSDCISVDLGDKLIRFWLKLKSWNISLWGKQRSSNFFNEAWLICANCSPRISVLYSWIVIAQHFSWVIHV